MQFKPKAPAPVCCSEAGPTRSSPDHLNTSNVEVDLSRGHLGSRQSNHVHRLLAVMTC